MKKYKFRLLKLSFIIIILSLIGTLYIKNIYANNSETSFQNPNIAENIDNDNGIDFTYLDFVKIQNDQYTHNQLPNQENTNWLRCTDFSFNLPDNSIINGIKVQIDDYSGIFNVILAQDIYLVLNEIKIGIDKESGSTIGTSDTDTYRVYGSSTDLWNTELTQNDIESSTFGIQIFYHNPSIYLTQDVFVDNIQIKIYYSISEPEPEPEPEINIDFIIIFSLLGIFSIMILILLFSILLIKK